MAILRDVPGVPVQIAVDGTALQEYGDPELAENSTSAYKYVEAIFGKNFEIYITLDNALTGDHDIYSQSFVDDNRIRKSCIARNKIAPSYLHVITGAESRIGGVTKTARLRFSDLATCK